MLLAKTFRSSTLKVALVSIAVFGTVVFALFGYVYWSTASYVLSRSDGAVAAEYTLVRKAGGSAGRDGLIATIEQRIAEQRLEGGVYLLADASFTPLAGNLTVWPSVSKSADGWANFSAPAQDGAERLPLRAKFETLPNGTHLLVGKYIDDLNSFVMKIKMAFAWSIVLIFVIAAVSSVTATRRTVGRIEAINAISRAIMERGLGTRIPLRGTHDEWDQLADNLNMMLERIEELIGEVKQVSDNVAHDLRTPLSHMRGRLETAYNRQRNAEDDQSLIGDTLADLDGVLRMFASLTRISLIEAKDRTAAFRIVDLSEIACEVVELFDAAAEEKGGHVDALADQSVLVFGDRDLLFDAVSNLVDNAIKHGHETCRVSVAVTRSDGIPVVSVTDNGPGIPAEEFQHVFKRFYRLERSRSTPGNGLGLSLVSAVAQLHGARIEMEDNAPGFKITLRFPLPSHPGHGL